MLLDPRHITKLGFMTKFTDKMFNEKNWTYHKWQLYGFDNAWFADIKQIDFETVEIVLGCSHSKIRGIAVSTKLTRSSNQSLHVRSCCSKAPRSPALSCLRTKHLQYPTLTQPSKCSICKSTAWILHNPHFIIIVNIQYMLTNQQRNLICTSPFFL